MQRTHFTAGLSIIVYVTNKAHLSLIFFFFLFFFMNNCFKEIIRDRPIYRFTDIFPDI